MSDPFRIVPAGDACVLLRFEERIDRAVNAQVVSVAAALGRKKLPGVRDIVPTFRSVAVHFDPLQTRYEALTDALRMAALGGMGTAPVAPAEIRVPVCYGGAFGPDLHEVAGFAGLSEREVVGLHADAPYHVFMLGFMPGFAYMGPVAERIAAPRRSVPRTRVAAGSVAIGGEQTGIYPGDAPGGWQLIGRTPLQVFDLSRTQWCLFKPGDTVQFYAVNREQYDALSSGRRTAT